MIEAPIFPRLGQNATVLVKGLTYKVHFWNVSRMYEFTLQDNSQRMDNMLGDRLKTEQEVADLINEKRITVLDTGLVEVKKHN